MYLFVFYFLNWRLSSNVCVRQVWVYAAAQNFNSLGVAFGGLITMSSYNKYNNKILRCVCCESSPHFAMGVNNGTARSRSHASTR